MLAIFSSLTLILYSNLSLRPWDPKVTKVGCKTHRNRIQTRVRVHCQCGIMRRCFKTCTFYQDTVNRMCPGQYRISVTSLQLTTVAMLTNRALELTVLTHLLIRDLYTFINILPLSSYFPAG